MGDGESPNQGKSFQEHGESLSAGLDLFPPPKQRSKTQISLPEADTELSSLSVSHRFGHTFATLQLQTAWSGPSECA